MFTRPIARPPSPPVAHPPVTGARLLRAGAVLPASGAPAPTDPTDALRSPFSLTTLLAHHAEGADEVMVRRVGLLGLAGARMCPNLLQRRLGPGSAARRSAEYQRFSSRTPMESRPLQQIWTTGATADLSEAAGVAPPDRKVIHRAMMRVRGGGARDRRRAHGGALPLGPLTFRWTTYVPLDHLRSVGPLTFRWTTCVRLDHRIS